MGIGMSRQVYFPLFTRVSERQHLASHGAWWAVTQRHSFLSIPSANTLIHALITFSLDWVTSIHSTTFPSKKLLNLPPTHVMTTLCLCSKDPSWLPSL